MAATFHPQVYRGSASAAVNNAGATPTKNRYSYTTGTTSIKSSRESKSVQDEYNEQQQQQREYSEDEDEESYYYSSSSSQQELPCHGLQNNHNTYPLHPASTPNCVLRAITAQQYAEMVYKHATAKTGEAVLFPWMHGADFAGSQQAANFGYVNGNRAATPRYRGLTTIAAHPARSIQEQSQQQQQHEGVAVYDHSRHATSASIATSYSTDSFSSTYSSSSSNPSSCSSSVFGGSDSLQSTPSSSSSISSCAQSIDLAPTPSKSITFGPEPHTSLLTSSWKPEEIFTHDGRFIRPTLPSNGVNFRNFRLQGAKYATISDIVVYGSGNGQDEDTVFIAKMAREAIKDMRRERRMSGERDLVQYQVYIIVDSFNVFEQKFPHLVQVDSLGWPRNKTSFAEKEHEEMRAFTQATEIAENVWIGNTFDVPWPAECQDASSSLNLPNSQGNPKHFSVCIEARDTAYMANTRELKEREKYMDDMQSKREHEARQDQLLALQQKKKRKPVSKASKVKKSRSPYWYSSSSEDEEVSSSKSSNSSSSRSSSDNEENEDDSDYEEFSASRSGSDSDKENFQDALGFSAAAIGSTAALGWRTSTSANKPAQFKKSKSLSAAKKNKISPTIVPEEKQEQLLHLSPEEILHLECFATSQNTSHPSAHQIIIDAILEHCMWIRTQARPHLRTSLDIRGSKSSMKDGHIAARRVLVHCADGYTDSSLLTLAYIMYDRVCSLPEAYLYLQNDKKRSFFVYPLDVTLLGQLEKRIMALARSQNRHKYNDDLSASQIAEMEKKEKEEKAAASRNAREPPSPTISTRSLLTRPGLFSRSSSAASSATISSIRSATPTLMAPLSRCSPSSSPAPANEAVAHAWFYDDRFDGHFPSRILDHVYLGNVNHASNALMLKELGITHVLSIGESALVPPHKHVQPTSSAFYSNASAAARARTPTNSLWLEQSLGNITVLDIQDIQDDGVDPILPHLLTAIEFIESAHQKGGKVLVHCRVGVSRSATLVIAYIMKHLDLSLVDAYLLVRAKRLNILIQPTILFMWTLHMYEEEIRESAFDADEKDGSEMENSMLMKRSARITWPVLATEMANLNHKYLGV